jgi:hypothetical protein
VPKRFAKSEERLDTSNCLENKTGCGFAEFAAQKSEAKCTKRNGFVSGGAFAAAKKILVPHCSGRTGAFRPAGTREALPGTNAALLF